MTKKTEILTHFYRWQFLRLNKGYQRDSDLYAESVIVTKGSCKLIEAKKQEIISKLKDKLYIRYGINGIYDHRKRKLPEGLRIYGGADFAVRKGIIKGIFENTLAENQEIQGNHLLETIRRIREVKRGRKRPLKGNVPLVTPKFVQLVINYDAKLGDIKSEVEKIIIPTQKLRQKELGIQRPKTRSEIAVADYDRYLQVWRLRKRGVKNEQVAKKIFPNRDSRDAEDRASKCLVRATALIKGEYRKISL